MLNLKKTAVAVLALSTSAAFAGTMGPVCSAVPVTVPCESSGWEVGARALYWNIGSNHNSYSISSTNGGSYTQNTGPGFGWGFQINGSLDYSTGKSLYLDWYHISTSKTKNFGAQSLTGGPGFSLSSFQNSYVSSYTSTAASATGKPKLDDVNMLFGQHIDFSDVTSMNLGYGWKWARVGNTFNTSNAGTAVTNTAGTAATYNYNNTKSISSTFNGFGPEVALLGQYELIDNLNIYGRGELSALAGYTKGSLKYTDVATNQSVTASNKLLSVAPVLAGKLGLNYGWDMTGYGVVVFDVNYDFRSYINAVRTVSATSGSTVSSFNSQGVVFGLDLKFANA